MPLHCYASHMTRFSLSLVFFCTAGGVSAEGPVIKHAEAARDGMGWRFDVTLSHPDTGWDHYADGWEVMTAAGNRLGYRKLHHPHVNEQPFTRSLTGIMVPDG